MGKESEETVRSGRRRFLQRAALATGATGLGVLAGDAWARGPEIPAESAGEPESSGYRETDHIRTYYEKARL